MPPIYLNHPSGNPCIEIRPWSKSLNRQKVPVYKIIETTSNIIAGRGPFSQIMTGAKLHLTNLPPNSGSPFLCPENESCV